MPQSMSNSFRRHPLSASKRTNRSSTKVEQNRKSIGVKKTQSEVMKLFQAVDQSPCCIMITNLDGNIEYVNSIFLQSTGYNRQEIIGKNPNILESQKTSSDTFNDMWCTVKHGETWQGEMTIMTKNGKESILFCTISPIRQSNGTIINYISIGEDITKRKKDEEKIAELAYYDPLTALPNRTLLLDRLKQAMSISSRNGMFGALLFVDLDHFKHVNDVFGHQKGDEILKQVADCLLLRIREGDTVSRFGGDEFVVLLTELGTDENIAANKAHAVAVKLLEALNQTYQLDEIAHHATASIGITIFDGASSDLQALLKQADMAMYESKKAGKNTLHFFDSNLKIAMSHHATMEGDLRTALKSNQFSLHYQGQFSGESKLTGAEVLLRWHHPEQGLMSPALFIPFAEETGLILPIGSWVIETACKQLALWERFPDKSDLVLAVNISALQFKQADFIDKVMDIIRSTGANPHRLKFELTESMLIDNVDSIIQKMLAFKKLGIRFSLDDFGTGYSSLSSLKNLPLDQLKIDKSFIHDVVNDRSGATITTTIVSLGKSLGLNVIAEGVETTAQRQFLADAGCFTYQGYLFSHPLTLIEFEGFAESATKRH